MGKGGLEETNVIQEQESLENKTKQKANGYKINY